MRTRRRDAENAERKKPQMNTDGTGKPDLTRVPIPSGEEGPGGTGKNVETSKRSGDPDSIGVGVEIRGWESAVTEN